jgi:hypothetical protein
MITTTAAMRSRRRHCMDNNQDKEYYIKTDGTYHKGQNIFYKGDEARILDLKPVFTIKIKGKSQVICGNILLKDICLK